MGAPLSRAQLPGFGGDGPGEFGAGVARHLVAVADVAPAVAMLGFDAAAGRIRRER